MQMRGSRPFLRLYFCARAGVSGCARRQLSAGPRAGQVLAGAACAAESAPKSGQSIKGRRRSIKAAASIGSRPISLARSLGEDEPFEHEARAEGGAVWPLRQRRRRRRMAPLHCHSNKFIQLASDQGGGARTLPPLCRERRRLQLGSPATSCPIGRPPLDRPAARREDARQTSSGPPSVAVAFGF